MLLHTAMMLHKEMMVLHKEMMVLHKVLMLHKVLASRLWTPRRLPCPAARDGSPPFFPRHAFPRLPSK